MDQHHHYHDHHSHHHEKLDPFMTSQSHLSTCVNMLPSTYVFDLVHSDVWQQPGPHRIWKRLDWQYSSCFVCRGVPKGRGVVTRSIRRIIFLVRHRSKVLSHFTNSSLQMLYLYLCFSSITFCLYLLMVKNWKVVTHNSAAVAVYINFPWRMCYIVGPGREKRRSSHKDRSMNAFTKLMTHPAACSTRV